MTREAAVRCPSGPGPALRLHVITIIITLYWAVHHTHKHNCCMRIPGQNVRPPMQSTSHRTHFGPVYCGTWAPSRWVRCYILHSFGNSESGGSLGPGATIKWRGGKTGETVWGAIFIFTLFSLIQVHRFVYQSKAHMQLPISD